MARNSSYPPRMARKIENKTGIMKRRFSGIVDIFPVFGDSMSLRRILKGSHHFRTDDVCNNFPKQGNYFCSQGSDVSCQGWSQGTRSSRVRSFYENAIRILLFQSFGTQALRALSFCMGLVALLLCPRIFCFCCGHSLCLIVELLGTFGVPFFASA